MPTFCIGQVDVLGLLDVIGLHVLEVDPGRLPVALVEADGEHAELEVDGEPVGHADEALSQLDLVLVVDLAERVDVLRLQHVPHTHVLVRVLGDYVALVVENAVLLDARRAFDGQRRLGVERLLLLPTTAAAAVVATATASAAAALRGRRRRSRRRQRLVHVVVVATGRRGHGRRSLFCAVVML